VNDRNETAETATPSTSPAGTADRASRYVARMLQQHLVDDPDARAWESEGTAVFVDISGFTQLSEALARKGREGAEQITDVIGRVFEPMLAVAYENGGSLLKFGGDALLLWFDEEVHAARAARAGILMRTLLSDIGRIDLPDTQVTLRMAQGVHSGTFHFFAIGESHLELLATGPAWSRLVTMQHDAGADEIVLSPETAAVLAPECVGEAKGPGRLLLHEPPGTFEKMPLRPRPAMAADAIARCLPAAVREHLRDASALPEHRPVTVAFIRYGGTDALIEHQGKEVAANALQQLLTTIERAAKAQDVSFLASDVDIDGGKLILTAGAPRVTGDDEERMLLALRVIVEGKLPLPIHIGVNRGAVFAGDIGPVYRRTYTVMGDAVNLAARVMAQAEPAVPAEIHATGDVLQRSKTTFETTELAPFTVKGKSEPVHALSVGRAHGSRARQAEERLLPLTGRNAELGVIRKAFAAARSGEGRLVEIIGEAGVGKTRLLEALRDAAAGFRKVHASCEAYTASKPYAVWRELLRESMGFGRDDPDAAVAERLRGEVTTRTPELLPWFPLIAIAFGIDIASTPEVQMLAEKNRRPKLHEVVGHFLTALMPDPQLVEIEDAHHMDGASAELLTYLTRELDAHPWLFAVARRPSSSGFSAPESPTTARIELKPLAPQEALKMAQVATEHYPLHMHVLEVVAQRSGGNPQFLRDLVRSVIATGGISGLPDSAEAAAMARIDALSPEDRSLVRRVAVFGLTFHPKMLSWFIDEADGALPPGPATWSRLHDFFGEEPDGYLRFRSSLLRDAAYEGLPFKLRRRLHGTVATRIAQESGDVDESASILSLHYLLAGDNKSAWRYATIAGKRADSVCAYVEAAELYSRALDAGRRLEDVSARELAAVHEALGNAWNSAAEFRKAAETYAAARALVATEPLLDAQLLHKISVVEWKLGKYSEALRWTDEALKILQGLSGAAAATQIARSIANYAVVLTYAGRTSEALDWAERALAKGEAVDDPESIGDAYAVMASVYGELGKEGAVPLMQRALDAFIRLGNLTRQGAILVSLGVVCQWEGRWDEALSYYEQSREVALKIGDGVGVALARVNAAEILIDRGEWVDAEALLLETLPFWRASQHRLYLGLCLWFLGRVSLCLGRFDEAQCRLEEAKANYLHVGAEEDVPAIEARIAECHLASGNPKAALELINALLVRAGSSNGVARVAPLLERIKGHALLAQGDRSGAREALDNGLTAAAERHSRFEETLTMLSLIELDRVEGVEPSLDMVNESRSRLSSLKVRAVPPGLRPPL
jgi:class 3 adenylate cyclase/tetratricopeptide (TPR) repeat protein